MTSLKFFLTVIQLNASLRSWGKDLIVKQSLLVSTSGNLCRRLWRKWILMLGCNRLTPLKPSVGHCFLKKLLAWSFQIVDICVLWPTHKGFYLFSSCILHLKRLENVFVFYKIQCICIAHYFKFVVASPHVQLLLSRPVSLSFFWSVLQNLHYNINLKINKIAFSDAWSMWLSVISIMIFPMSQFVPNSTILSNAITCLKAFTNSYTAKVM